MEAARTRGRDLCLLLTLAVVVVTTAAAAARRGNADTRGHGFIGDMCENGTGVCRIISNCPEALAALQRQEEPKICSYDGFSPIVCCPVGGKASRMCQTYGKAVFKAEKTFNLPPQIIQVNQCAIKGVPFIAGGEKAESNEFPHMALLGYGSNPKAQVWLCGGSLISKRYIITAAHCLQTSEGQPQWVRLGELNLAVDREKNKHADYEVESHIQHPKYRDSVYYDDIALLRLKKDVTFTASIRPACLYMIPEIRDKELIASGWGYTDWATPEISESLMKVKLPVQKTNVCQDAFKTLSTTNRLRNGITEQTMVCAGTLQGGKDTCRGDSGGPLQLKLSTPYCTYGIVGVTSFGKANCGTTKSPAVYTRVSYYIPWIESVVWANDE